VYTSTVEVTKSIFGLEVAKFRDLTNVNLNIFKMKKISILILSLVASSFALINSETQVGVYNSFDDDGYNFIITVDDDLEEVMTFQKVEEDVLKSINLKSKDYEGVTFQITYEIEVVTEEDDEGNEIEYEIYVITNLKKIE
jgi:secreted protein with Ig-like and vWFA domain